MFIFEFIDTVNQHKSNLITVNDNTTESVRAFYAIKLHKKV